MQLINDRRGWKVSLDTVTVGMPRNLQAECHLQHSHITHTTTSAVLPLDNELLSSLILSTYVNRCPR